MAETSSGADPVSLEATGFSANEIGTTKLRQREFIGSALGLIIFALGIGLLGLTFKLAYDLFSSPPEKTLGLTAKKTMDLALAGDSAASLLLRIVLLLVMAGVGSMVANRGIALYCGARNLHK